MRRLWRAGRLGLRIWRATGFLGLIQSNPLSGQDFFGWMPAPRADASFELSDWIFPAFFGVTSTVFFMLMGVGAAKRWWHHPIIKQEGRRG